MSQELTAAGILRYQAMAAQRGITVAADSENDQTSSADFDSQREARSRRKEAAWMPPPEKRADPIPAAAMIVWAPKVKQ